MEKSRSIAHMSGFDSESVVRVDENGDNDEFIRDFDDEVSKSNGLTGEKYQRKRPMTLTN